MKYRILIPLFLLCLFPFSLVSAGEELAKSSDSAETLVSSQEPSQAESKPTAIDVLNEKINLEVNSSKQHATEIKKVAGELRQIKVEHETLMKEVADIPQISQATLPTDPEVLLKAKLANADRKKMFLEKKETFLKYKMEFQKWMHQKLQDYLRTVFSEQPSFFAINIEIKGLRERRSDRLLEQVGLRLESEHLSNRIAVEERYLSAKDSLIAISSDNEKAYMQETIALAEERLQVLQDTKALIDEKIEFAKAQIDGNVEFDKLLRLRRGEVFAREFNAKNIRPYSSFEIASALLAALILMLIFRSRKIIFSAIGDYQLFSRKGLFLLVVKFILFSGFAVLAGYGVLNVIGFRFAAQMMGLAYLNIAGGWLLFLMASCLIERISVWIIQMMSKTDQVEVRNASVVYSLLNAGLQVFLFFAISSEILSFWAFRQEVTQALLTVLNYPFIKAAKIEFSLWILARSVLVFWGFHWFSRFTNSFLKTYVYPKTSLDRNSQHAIKSVIQFVLITLGAVLAIQLLGINLSALAVFSGTLGLGIGLGLQDIIKNIVSGFVIYFERPIRIGDVVEVGTTPGQVKSIRTRSTIINTFDNISLVVPNSEFLSQRVVNWSLSDRVVRIEARVGVAYGSDVELVRQTLLEITKANKDIMQKPEPVVVFEDFADSALLFRVLFWVDVEDRMEVKSQINFSIYSQFNEKGIVIPFPQRDVHIKSSSVDVQKKA